MKKRIYMVEDNVDNADLVIDMIGELFSIETFPSGRTLLEFLEKEGTQQPDLFILDISLPGMDGITLLKHMQESDKVHCPVLALTAHALKGDEDRFRVAGFDDYLSKPILDEEQLLEKVNTLIEK